MATALEALMNAEINLRNIGAHAHPLGTLAMNQLHNGIEVLRKGYPLGTEVEELLIQYGEIDKIPRYENEPGRIPET